MDLPRGIDMVDRASYYFGNAVLDQVRGSGWFVGQFVSDALGLRHQTAVEIKWGLHPHGERRPQPWANGNGTTISVLIRGSLWVSFYTDATPRLVKLTKEGDYVVYGPEVVHSWEAVGETLVLSIRFPSVEVSEPKADVSE
ncbi:MAG: hypothetical protein WA459_14405 [Stellaceae bacterium]